MRVILAVLCVTFSSAIAAAQSNSQRLPGDSPHSDGRTHMSTQGQMQPQGPTGPTGTTTGGAPASSPQGQTPPGMQSAPEGSSKTIIETDAKK